MPIEKLGKMRQAFPGHGFQSGFRGFPDRGGGLCIEMTVSDVFNDKFFKKKSAQSNWHKSVSCFRYQEVQKRWISSSGSIQLLFSSMSVMCLVSRGCRYDILATQGPINC